MDEGGLEVSSEILTLILYLVGKYLKVFFQYALKFW